MRLRCVFLFLALTGCEAPVEGPADDRADAGPAAENDAGAAPDAGSTGVADAGGLDAGLPDAGPPPVALRGRELLLHGAPFVPRGLIIEGLLIPLADATKCLSDFASTDPMYRYCQRHLDARDYLAGTGAFTGHDALSLAISNWNIDTVRFNVLQVALDPASPFFSPAYLAEVEAAVARARARQLVVFLALFDSPANDEPYWKDRYPKLALNDAVTEAAAKTLATRFGDDPLVFLELLNEPYLARTEPQERWRLWRDGGTVPTGAFANHVFIGVNQIIETIRATGAKNPIVLQPPSASFVGFPGGVTDPLDLVVYAAHPFLVEGDDDNVNWQLHFGEFAQSHPFVMTAWNVSSDVSNGAKDQWCAVRGPDHAQKYLDFLSQLGAGVMGFALDVNGSVIVSFQNKLDKASRLSATCGPGGGGELLQAHFTSPPPALPNQAPALGPVSLPSSLRVGQALSLMLTATDADHDPRSFQVRWGDGATSPAVGEVQTSGAFTHAYLASGTYALELRVVDARGAEQRQTLSVTVN